jgi:hypothetical protein
MNELPEMASLLERKGKPLLPRLHFHGRPQDACAGTGLVALGFPAYFWLRRRAVAA